LDDVEGQTYSWGGTQIQQDPTLFQKAILLVQLDKLESGSGTVTLFLGQSIPLIKTTLSVFLLDSHCGGCGGEITSPQVKRVAMVIRGRICSTRFSEKLRIKKFGDRRRRNNRPEVEI
jgi:hypothetical protein